MKKFFILYTSCAFFFLYSNATVRVSTSSGSWSNPATWGGTVPANGDDIIVSSGHVVTINVNPNSIVNVTLNGTLQFDATGTGRVWTVTGSFFINPSGAFTCAAPGTATVHTFNYNGTNLSNVGTLNMVNGSNKCNVTIGGSGTQTIGGTSTCSFNKLIINNTGGKFVIDYGGGSFTPSESAPTKLTGSITTADTLAVKQGLLIACTTNSSVYNHTVANLKLGSGASKITSSVNVFTQVTTITVNTGLILNDASNSGITFTVNGTFTSPNMAQANSAIAMALIGPNCQGGANNSTICTINGETNLPDLFGFVGNSKLFGGTEPKRPDIIFNGNVFWQYSKSHTIDIPFTSEDFFIKTFFFGIFDSIGTHPRIVLNGGSVATPNTFNIPFKVFEAPIQTSSPLGNTTTAQISESAADWQVNGNWSVVSGASIAVHSDDTLQVNGTLRVKSGGEIAGAETETDPNGYVAIHGPQLQLATNSVIYVENLSGLGKGTIPDSGLNVAFKNRTADINWNLSAINTAGTVDYATSSQTVTDRTYNNLSLSGSGFTKTLAGNTTVNKDLTNATSVTLTNGGFTLTAKGSVVNNGIQLGTGKISLAGTTNQSLSGTGANWGNVQLNNAAGATCTTNINTSGIINFDAGILTTSSSAKLVLTSIGNYTGGSTSSYVSGPMSKTTSSTSEFIFPVGKGGSLRQVSVTPSSTSSTTWTAEYFNSGYSNITAFSVPITSVSENLHWTLDRSGSANANVKLYWGSEAGLPDLNGLKVGKWDGSSWTDAGAVAVNGSAASGKVTSDVVSSFSPFTLAEANTITTGAIAGSPFCPGEPVTVPFTSTGTFNSGNVYTAQLSDKNGSFGAAKNIGTLSSTSNAGNISGAFPTTSKAGTKYRIRVISNHPVVTGSNNGVNLSVTACAAPTGITSTGITQTKATITWNTVTCAFNYTLQYRKQGTTTWTKKKNLTGNSKNITGLTANTVYEYQMQTLCTADGKSKSAFSAIQTFTTALKLSESVIDHQFSVNIYPNPVSADAMLSIESSSEDPATIIICNAVGQIMQTFTTPLQEGSNMVSLNLEALTAGIYFVKVMQGDDRGMQKLIKQ